MIWISHFLEISDFEFGISVATMMETIVYQWYEACHGDHARST